MKEKQKLLVIAGGDYIFGAEKVTLDVIEGLRNEGYNVAAIISGWGDGKFAKVLDHLEVKFYKLKLGWYYLSKLLWSLDSLIHYPGALFRFLRLRKNFKDWPVYIISFRQVILLWPFFRKNIVYHVHDVNSKSRQSRFFLRIIDKKVVKYIAVSNFIRQDLVNCGISSVKIDVIHNGIAITNENTSKLLKGEMLTIGVVGQIIARKGHDTIIEALDLLNKRGLKIQLIIAGSGNPKYIALLKKNIENSNLNKLVTWRGFTYDLKDIYEGIDILVAPTISAEPFGLIAIEANMFSIPVIASNAGGFKETIKEGFNGFLVSVKNPIQIADKIEYFYFNRDQVSKMGNNGRDNARQYFDKKTMIKKIENLITNL